MQEELFNFISNYVTLTVDEKNSIIELDIFKFYKKKEFLLKQDEYCNFSFFVIKGCIRKFYIIDGDEKTTDFYTEMQGLTPHCVSDSSKSNYNIQCVEDSIITLSTPEIEKNTMEKFPKFEKLCRVLSEELLAKEKIEFDEFKTSSPESRYLKLLKSRPSLLQRVPQHQIASFLGITAQSLSRLRARISSKNYH